MSGASASKREPGQLSQVEARNLKESDSVARAPYLRVLLALFLTIPLCVSVAIIGCASFIAVCVGICTVTSFALVFASAVTFVIVSAAVAVGVIVAAVLSLLCVVGCVCLGLTPCAILVIITVGAEAAICGEATAEKKKGGDAAATSEGNDSHSRGALGGMASMRRALSSMCVYYLRGY